MAYTREIREQVLKELKSGVSAGKISRTYQISIPTIYNWKNKYLSDLNLAEETVSKEEKQAVDNLSKSATEGTEDDKNNRQENETLSVEEIVHKIVSLKQNGSLEEALSMCNHSLYKDHPNILFQKVDILLLIAIRDKDIEKATEAYKMCKVFELEDERFTGRLYKILSNFPALKIEEFPILKLSIEELNSMDLTKLIPQLQQLFKARCLEEVLYICNHLTRQDNPHILAEKAKALFYLGRNNQDVEKVKESYAICQRIKVRVNLTYLIEKIETEFPDVDWSLYQLEVLGTLSREELREMPMPEFNKQLRLLVTSGNLEEAINIIDESSYRNNPNIVQQKIKALFILGKKNNDMERINECYRICLRFKENPHFQYYMGKIQSEFSEIDWSSCQPQEDLKTSEIKTKKDCNDLIKELLMKIHCDFITASEIETAEIDEWYKDLLMLAFSHKKSRENALVLAKKLKAKYCQDESNKQKIKILNKLLERIKVKKGISFDVNDYIPYLPAYFDFNLVSQILKEKELKENQEVIEKPKAVQNLQIATPIQDSTKLQKKPEKRMIVVEGKPVTARYQQITSSTQGISSERIKKLKIKDVFESEIFEIGKLLYVQMQRPRNVKRGSRAWDTLELLKEKSASDEWAVRSILSLIATLDIETNWERNNRIIQELEERSNQRMKEHEQQKIKNIGVNN